MSTIPNIHSKIKIVGDEAIDEIEVGKEASFQVLNSSGGGGAVTFAFEGPHHVDYSTKRLEDGTIEVTFMVTKAGRYEIKVFYQDKQVNGSPFYIHATREMPKKEIPPELEEKIEKIKVYGKNLEYGKPLAFNKVVIDCTEADIDKKELHVTVASPRRRSSVLDLEDMDDGKYVLTYKPTDPGIYMLNVEVQERHIPGSPFMLKVRGGSISDFA
ncbi:filamin-C-like protein [Dinothrombium tinctorium]|uniref:Filamin-C-like protein n=1 Tax=Dinothrombium tinctorium TaxID=1965070 RepID=A0A3S3NUG8_9ACAR|nr:filamin-C-like protein [Dinothrombium tinctorium]